MYNTGLSVININIFSFFIHAGIAIKCVIILLLLFSIWTWSIIVQKIFHFLVIRRKFIEFERLFWSGQSLESLYKLSMDRENIGLAAVFMAAMCEWKKSFEKGACSPRGIQDRIDRMMNVAISREIGKIISRLDNLSTIASVSFFVGLLGNIICVVNAVQYIAESKFVSPSVFVPGIMESSIITIMCVCVSIPAAMAYNKFMSDAKKYSGKMEEFADEFFSILSRQTEKDIS